MVSDMIDDQQSPTVRWLLFSPSGRVGRQAYIMSILFWLALAGAAIASMFRYEHNDAGLALSTLALVIVSLGLFVSYIMLGIKRLHDMGFPAPFVILLFIPAVSLLALLALFFWPSAPPNQFGMFTNRPKQNCFS
jgi:uncharacterized membrane protein YhaH (DUF805 family)